VTFASPTNPTAQITLMRSGGSPRLVPQVTVEVADVDAVHSVAVRQRADVVYPLTDEPWGVRRFFLRDPNGVIINVMCHRTISAPREGCTQCGPVPALECRTSACRRGRATRAAGDTPCSAQAKERGDG
jgi:hypothetical protein